MESNFLEVNGTKIYCEAYGEGKPLVLMHGGLGLDSSYFKVPGILNLSKKGIQVILYDHRGHGKSSRAPTSTYTHKRWIKDFLKLIKELGIKKVNLLGHSYGGWLALEWAVSNPPELGNLILANTHAGPVDDSDVPTHKSNQQLKLHVKKNWPNLFFGRDKHWEIFNRIKYSYKPYNVGYHREAVRYDVRKKLRKMKARTLIIVGKQDQKLFLERSRQMYKKIPNSTLEVFGNCKHFPFIDRPKKFEQTILNFLT